MFSSPGEMFQDGNGMGVKIGVREKKGMEQYNNPAQSEPVYFDPAAGIYLRLMTYEDTDRIVSWRNREEVRRNFVYQEAFTPEGHENWIHSQIETGKAVQMMICDQETDTALGSVYLRDIDRQHHKAEFGIFIGEETSRGRGVGTAATKLMLRYCFEEAGLHRVYLRAYRRNGQAVRCYEKAGFRQEGILRDDVYVRGEYQDMVWMGVIKRDWEAGKPV